MRTRILISRLVLILLVGFFPFIAFPNNKEKSELAKALYEQKDYIGSVQILEKIKDKSSEVIYWLWKSEKEIGALANPSSIEETSPNHKYYQYIKDHQEYFVYYEPVGNYLPSNKRYQEISSLFPDSGYAGTIFFELIEYNYEIFSEGGLDEKGRITLISQYQRFINRYSTHPYVIRAQEEIKNLEILPEKMLKELGFVVGGESILLPYEKKFVINQNIYKKYIGEWLKSGPYREYGIEVFVGKKEKIKKDILAGFDIPIDIKKTIQSHLEEGKLIVLSEAAFKNKKWQGEKFLVFDPK